MWQSRPGGEEVHHATIIMVASAIKLLTVIKHVVLPQSKLGPSWLLKPDSVIPHLRSRLYISLIFQMTKTPYACLQMELLELLTCEVQKKHAIVVNFGKHGCKATDQHKRKPKQLSWFSFQSLCEEDKTSPSAL